MLWFDINYYGWIPNVLLGAYCAFFGAYIGLKGRKKLKFNNVYNLLRVILYIPIVYILISIIGIIDRQPYKLIACFLNPAIWGALLYVISYISIKNVKINDENP